MQNSQDVQLAAAALRAALPPAFQGKNTLGLILGTGLSCLADALEGVRAPFAELPHFPQSTVSSHAGTFIYGHISGLPVLVQQGRCHLYEGRTPAEVCMGVRVMGALGVRTLFATNAAGALDPLFSAGTLMRICDMINHTGLSPLTGTNNDAWGERFPDMGCPFDKRLGTLADACALENGIRLERGVYIGVHGPEMETPAETRMYRNWGADAIGMSTVLEVIAARHMGMRVLGVSCLTNKNLPDHMEPAPIQRVIEMAEACSADLSRLIKSVCANLAERGPLWEEAC